MAKLCTKCGTEKPLTEFSFLKGVPRSHCKACKAAASAAWRLANPGKMEAKAAECYRRNPARKMETNAAWRAANPEKAKANQAAAMARWQKKFPEKAAAHAGKRRALKLQATPKWADEGKIAEFYAAASFLGMVTGEWYHVDHIVPLKGKTVCGLHNEFNLQVIPGAENMKKGNRTWPGKP